MAVTGCLRKYSNKKHSREHVYIDGTSSEHICVSENVPRPQSVRIEMDKTEGCS